MWDIPITASHDKSLHENVYVKVKDVSFSIKTSSRATMAFMSILQLSQAFIDLLGYVIHIKRVRNRIV